MREVGGRGVIPMASQTLAALLGLALQRISLEVTSVTGLLLA